MNTNTLIGILVAVALLGGAYWYFLGAQDNDSPLSTIPQASVAQKRFETLANQLPASFDTTLFSNPRFNALVDITQPIQQEEIGRTDPFATVPGLTGHAKPTTGQ